MQSEGRSQPVLQFLSLLALLGPLLIFLAFAGSSYSDHFRAAEDRMGRSLDLMQEHGSKVFETYELLASYTDELLGGLSDEEVRAQEPALNAKLKRFSDALPQVQDVWVVAADARPLVTANVFPVPRNLDLSDREYYRIQKDRDAGLFISEVLRGRAQNVTFFQFSRRRLSPDGSFRGVVAVSVQPNYFRDYYAQIARSGTITGAALQRADGVALALYPAPPPRADGQPPAYPPTRGLQDAIQQNPERGLYRVTLPTDGLERMVAYRKLPQYPIYLSVGLRTRVVQGAWLWSLVWPLALGLPASLALFGLSRLALRYTARESAALVALQEETARRETAEAERRQVDALHRAYYNNTSESLFVIRAHKDGRFTIEDRNRAHEQAFKIDTAKIRGCELHEFMPAEIAERTVGEYRRCVEANAPVRFETEFHSEKDTATWETVLAPVHDEQGRITHIIGAGRDISDRLELEASLRQAQKMEALGALTGGIAHDFNNLLTVVMGNLDLLRRAKEDRKPRLIDNALQAVEQGRKLTQQLLAFGRRQPVKPEVISLKALIVGMDDMLAQSLRGDIRLEFDLADDLWPVEVDPAQLQAALINVAANARDAMPKGGTLTLKAENTVLQDGERVEGIAVSITDTGQGMPREVLARVFEPFFTTKEVGKGTGLGLAQVYGFAQQAGGSVDIRSEEGRGTTVTLYLPRTRTEVVDGAREAAVREGIVCPRHILLVDDNAQVAEVATAILTEQGHQVTYAANADEALTKLETSQAFDLVFSDLVMPGERNGLDLARTVRERWPSLPVILATGYSDAANRATQEGFTLVTKPYAPDTLLRAVAELNLPGEALRTENVIPFPGA
jgi:PAS domain S-box-containing protein